jgi:antitoxin component of RelBE/YafQ-DinJ toxin-antitoxin module
MNDTRTEMISVKVSKAEKQALTAKTEKLGITPSKLIRSLINQI